MRNHWPLSRIIPQWLRWNRWESEKRSVPYNKWVSIEDAPKQNPEPAAMHSNLILDLINNPASKSTFSSTVFASNYEQQTHQLKNTNPNTQPYGFPFLPPTYDLALPHQIDQTTAFSHWASCTKSSSNPTNNYTGCTINNYFGKPQEPPQKKKRRAFIIDSDDEE